ncbi:GTP-binding protein [Candidatus Woesearchaeota archaeon]|nr:GTP-binding protein [Candidatus Woesearchaeota archaeon]
MADYNEKIKELEDRIANTKYNKRTQAAIGLYKAQLAKLKEREVTRGQAKSGGQGWEVRKTGDGTVILIGFPSAGKSTLLNALTDAKSETAAYAFTTLTCIPGVMQHKHAKIQILDVPGIVKGAASGKGRGKEVLASMRSADVCLILLDATRPEEYDVIVSEIYDTHIRVNQRKPDVKITKTGKDGIKIGATCRLTHLTHDTIKAVLKEFRINNADVVLREDVTVDQLIDCIEANKKYMPGITVINKSDLVTPKELRKIKKKYSADLAISAQLSQGIEELKELIFEKLDLIRIYLKEPMKEADMEVPLIVFRDFSVGDVCKKLHKDFISKFKFARVWGPSAKFDGQKVMTKHKLYDQDVLEVHLR